MKDLKLLQSAVEFQFGKRIQSKKHCEELSIAIYSTTGSKISLNTLRRFFELLESNNNFRQDILNFLSNYVGHSDFEAFQNSNAFDSQNVNHPEHYYYQLPQEKLINELQKIPVGKPLVNVIRQSILFHRNDSEVLAILFEFAFCLESLWQIPWLKIDRFNLVQSMGLCFYDLNEKVQNLILEHSQDCAYLNEFFHFFPNQNQITRYAELVEQHYQTHVESEQIFKQLIILKSKFYQEKEISSISEKLNSLKVGYDLHPLLVGRYYELKILLSKSDYDTNQALIALESHYFKLNDSKERDLNQQLLLILPLGALLRQHRFDLIAEVLCEVDWQNKSISDFWEGNANNHFKIFLAAKEIAEGNIQNAKSYFNGVIPEQFPLFEDQLQREHLDIIRKILHS